MEPPPDLRRLPKLLQSGAIAFHQGGQVPSLARPERGDGETSLGRADYRDLEERKITERD